MTPVMEPAVSAATTTELLASFLCCGNLSEPAGEVVPWWSCGGVGLVVNEEIALGAMALISLIVLVAWCVDDEIHVSSLSLNHVRACGRLMAYPIA